MSHILILLFTALSTKVESRERVTLKSALKAAVFKQSASEKECQPVKGILWRNLLINESVFAEGNVQIGY